VLAFTVLPRALRARDPEILSGSGHSLRGAGSGAAQRSARRAETLSSARFGRRQREDLAGDVDAAAGEVDVGLCRRQRQTRGGDCRGCSWRGRSVEIVER
jgi:hypothetical protein